MAGRGAEALEELRIRYRRVGNDRYLVLANGPASAADVIEWRPRVDFVHELDELFKEAFREKPHAVTTPIGERLRDLGRELFDALLPKPIRTCLETSLKVAEAEYCALRLKFHFPAELSGQPVEILCPPEDDPLGGPLALNTDLSVVRSVSRSPGNTNTRLPKPEEDPKPFTVLVVVASPRDRPPLKARGELDRLQSELGGLAGMDLVTVDFLGGPDSEELATLAALSNRVRRRRNPLAVLLISHGEISPDQGQACVVLESEERSAQLVPAEQVAATLGERGTVRFVALNLCIGARIVGRDPLSGVAQAMISNGIPAVVGMSTGVTDEAGSRFSAPLFRALSRNDMIDKAVRVARNQMSVGRENTLIEWCAPVLCVEDGLLRGRLFKVPGLRAGIDPMLEGQQAVRRLRNAPHFDDLAPAAFFHRATGNWGRVQGVAREGKDEANDELHRELFTRLEREAGIELALPNIEELCRSLTNASPASVQLPNVPQAIVGCLAGEVARADKIREHYKRAKAAEKEGDWQAAINAWNDVLKIDEYDKHAIERRENVRIERELSDLYATGCAKVEAGHWPEAERLFNEILKLRPDGYCDAELALFYSRGRQSEGDWAAAVEVLRRFGDQEYRDGRPRLVYAQGRLAQDNGKWAEAGDAYEKLGDLLPGSDAPLRCTYARGRAAEDVAWPVAEQAYAALPQGYADRDLRLGYANGRVAEGIDDWSGAAEAYHACGSFRDALVRVIYVKSREIEDGGDLTDALAQYESVADQCADAQQRATRLRKLREALGWMDGLPRIGLVEDPAASTGRASPYKTLRGAGINPRSTAHQVKDISYDLMQDELWTPEIRLAWDELRSVARRLEHDARLYRLVDVEGLAQTQRKLEPGPPEELLTRLCEKLDHDAPLFCLLSGQRGEAHAGWEVRLARDLGATNVAHALALTWMWHGVELGDAMQHEQAAGAWERAIAYWVCVLSAAKYWESWRIERASSYQHSVSAADMARARLALADWLLDMLAERADRCRLDGRTDDTERYRRLRLALEVELAAAQALTETGTISDADGPPSIYGPRFLRLYPSLQVPLGDLVARLEPEAEQEVDPIARLRLRGLFSELGEAIVLLEQNQPDRALDALHGVHRMTLSELPHECEHETSTGATPPQCPQCAEFLERNPGYRGLRHRRSQLLQDAVHLATHALLTLAQLALVEGPHGLDTVLKRWREAVDVAANIGAQVRTKRAIVPVVLAQADVLMEEQEPERLTGERLTEGVNLVAAARQLVGRADEGQLVAKEAELLTARGVWYGSWCYPYEELSYERAVADLRRAVTLSPDSLDPRENLAQGLVHWVDSLHHESSAEHQLRLLGEAVTVLHRGLVDTSNHPRLLATLDQVLDELEEWCLDELSGKELHARLREAHPLNAADESSISGLLNLVETVRSAPRLAETRQKLIDTINGTIFRIYSH